MATTRNELCVVFHTLCLFVQFLWTFFFLPFLVLCFFFVDISLAFCCTFIHHVYAACQRLFFYSFASVDCQCLAACLPVLSPHKSFIIFIGFLSLPQPRCYALPTHTQTSHPPQPPLPARAHCVYSKFIKSARPQLL